MVLALGLAAAAAASLPPRRSTPPGDAPVLAVRVPSGWREWWRWDQAPSRWSAPLPALQQALRWRPVGDGIAWGNLTLSGSGEAWRIRVIVVRIDPTRVRLATAMLQAADGRSVPWTVDSAPAAALVALNTGQFTSQGPWGWLVRAGAERRAPGTGPLAPALVIDTAGGVRIVPPDSIAALRGDRAIAEAFQSYPALLENDGDVPRALRQPGRGVDLTHRDGRLALGLSRDGHLLIALTRFEGLGGALSNLPFGLTTPEMAALMGALGCRRAMLLDGGISSQLRLGAESGAVEIWRGIRRVPLGLVVSARSLPQP